MLGIWAATFMTAARTEQGMSDAPCSPDTRRHNDRPRRRPMMRRWAAPILPKAPGKVGVATDARAISERPRQIDEGR